MSSAPPRRSSRQLGGSECSSVSSSWGLAWWAPGKCFAGGRAERTQSPRDGGQALERTEPPASEAAGEDQALRVSREQRLHVERRCLGLRLVRAAGHGEQDRADERGAAHAKRDVAHDRGLLGLVAVIVQLAALLLPVVERG